MLSCGQLGLTQIIGQNYFLIRVNLYKSVLSVVKKKVNAVALEASRPCL